MALGQAHNSSSALLVHMLPRESQNPLAMSEEGRFWVGAGFMLATEFVVDRLSASNSCLRCERTSSGEECSNAMLGGRLTADAWRSASRSLRLATSSSTSALSMGLPPGPTGPGLGPYTSFQRRRSQMQATQNMAVSGMPRQRPCRQAASRMEFQSAPPTITPDYRALLARASLTASKIESVWRT